VHYTKLGSCPTICPAQRPTICTFNYAPVCAHGTNGYQLGTYGNRCTACSDGNVYFTEPGECPLLIVDSNWLVCSPSRPTVCTEEFIETCGYDENGNVIGTYGNQCFACADNRVYKAKFGACPAPPVSKQVKCPLRRALFCAATRNVVCGYFAKNANSNVPYKAFINRCQACKNTKIAYTVLGACPPYPTIPGKKNCPANRPDICI
jgi:hypothetical protein